MPKADRVKPPTAITLRAAWMATRPAWSQDVSSWVFGRATRDAATAHKNFLTGAARFLRFAKKGTTRERFTEIGRRCHLEAGVLQLPKIGSVGICSPDPAVAVAALWVCGALVQHHHGPP